jgi:hypothetical protein
MLFGAQKKPKGKNYFNLLTVSPRIRALRKSDVVRPENRSGKFKLWKPGDINPTQNLFEFQHWGRTLFHNKVFSRYHSLDTVSSTGPGQVQEVARRRPRHSGLFHSLHTVALFLTPPPPPPRGDSPLPLICQYLVLAENSPFIYLFFSFTFSSFHPGWGSELFPVEGTLSKIELS